VTDRANLCRERRVGETTVAASLAIDMVRFLERRGHAPVAICTAAGLDPAVLSRPDDRIPASRMSALWRVAVERTGDEAIAVQMASEFHPAALDILGYVVLTCRHVGDVLACLVRYAGLLNGAMTVSLTHEGPRTIVALDFDTAHGARDAGVPARYVADSMWIGLAQQLRKLAAEPVLPLEVRFRHRVRDETPYRAVLTCPITFGALQDQFILASTDLARALPSANPALFGVFEQHAEAVLASLGSRGSMVSRVAAVLTAQLKGRIPAIGEVASELAMSARNLQRALQAEQRTYQEVLDDVRAGLARRYLADEQNTVSQVAFLLGFSEAAAFHRAFKRWTGQTPADLRKSLVT
jgi:AraC-like DNA-binding protein